MQNENNILFLLTLDKTQQNKLKVLVNSYLKTQNYKK